MKKRRKNRFAQWIAAVVSIVLLGTYLGSLSMSTLTVSAICCRKDGFDKSRYTLTGNVAQDVATIAKSQAGRTCSDFGYSGVDYGAWCDEYVADCLENAGCDDSIVAHGGTVADFESKMRKRGAVAVSSPQPGDLLFFSWSHVEIVTRVEGGEVYCAGGNNQGKTYPGGRCAGERNAQSVAKSMGGSIRLYLRPNYPDWNPEPVTATTVSTVHKYYAPGSDIDINWNYVAGATGYWIDIYKDGEGIISSNLGNVNSYTLKNAGSAEYGIFVTTFRDDGNWQSACSECCRFFVKDVNAPVVYTNHEYYAPNAEVDIMWDLVDGATGYWIGIWNDGEHILSQSLNDANCSKYTYQCTKGKYGVFVTAYSENGGWSSACSNCYNFYVQDVSAPNPTTNSNCYTPDSDVEVTWDKVDSASGYWIDIWKDGEHILTKNIGNVLSYTTSSVKSGKYGVFVTAYNDCGGWTNATANVIEFNVKERPSDTILLQRYLLGNDSLTQTQWQDADLNADGAVDSFDLAMLRQKLVA